MKIKVTSEDIEKGTPGDCTRCPVARALKRRGFKYVSVHEERIEFRRTILSEKRQSILSGYSKVSMFVAAFDRGDNVAPFTFELDTRGAADDRRE